MKWIFKQDEPNVRYIESFYLPSCWIDPCVLKQRKTWWGWRTVSWCYSFIIAHHGLEYIVRWLDWEEGNKNAIKIKTLQQLTKNANNANKTI